MPDSARSSRPFCEVAGTIRYCDSWAAIHRTVARWLMPVLNSDTPRIAELTSVVIVFAASVSEAESAGSVGAGVNAVPASEVVPLRREMST